MPKTNKIICGAMPEATKVFPDGYFNCCISSPPYWALRDYGVDGQLGLEPTFEEYIDKLCTIYDEVKRVLRADGTCWVNLGDTYAGSPTGSDRPSKIACMEQMEYRKKNPADYGKIQNKSLCLIPQRFAIEMVNRGWILRNVIVWHKPNPMPSSAKDRFTVDFEYVYFFVKSKKYWFEPQYEPHSLDTQKRESVEGRLKNNAAKNIPFVKGFDKVYINPLGRNKRTVWTIPTQPFPEAHFATFPEKLVEPMIKAGCPEFVCTKCGKAREKIYDKSGGTTGKSWHDHNNDIGAGIRQTSNGIPLATAKGRKEKENPYIVDFKGYTDCGCNADWRPGIVLDCFCWVWHNFTGSCQVAA